MKPFINRELSWLKFNRRVLAEAQRQETPVLDRLKFLAITASNLDEFFMVRAAYLNDRKADKTPDSAGLIPSRQLELAIDESYKFQLDQAEVLNEILNELGKNGIRLLKPRELTISGLNYARKYFEDEVLPVITPLAIDPGRPFPFLSNQSLNIGVRMYDAARNNVYGVIQVPSILPRFVRANDGAQEDMRFILLEDLITYYLSDIFNLYGIKAFGCFRITRSADFDADDDTENLMEEMKRTIKKRKHGKAIRLELSGGFDEKTKVFLRKMLNISKKYISELPCFLDLAAFMKIASLDFDRLRAPRAAPKLCSGFSNCGDIFSYIREGDRMLHHPYESFSHVEDFIYAAAEDPSVLAIKQTLYRVSGRGRVLPALIKAAEAGKQVTVLVEIKARFDEENNIEWANQLERAGCHVIYGLAGLKTHCKITLAVRREEDGIRRYLHLSTGNYNAATAMLYTDIGMFTCRPSFGADASALFNHLTGFSIPPEYNKLVVAPEGMKRFFLNQIRQEIQNAKDGLASGISIKINSLLDKDIVELLYEASSAGVKINLLVRGICAAAPGVSGVSENIRVRSIVGRFLEHSRIYIFENAGEPLVYLGSADLMPRNLERRVELAFPVEDGALKSRVLGIMALMWRDNVCAWELEGDLEYRRVKQAGKRVNSQAELLD